MIIPFTLNIKLENNGFGYLGYYKVKWMKLQLLEKEISSNKEENENKEDTGKKWDISKKIKVLKLILETIPYIDKIIFAALKSINLEKLALDINMGLDSPVLTVQFTGIFWAIASIVNINPHVYMCMQPVFIKPTFDAQLKLQMKIQLLYMVIAAVKLLLKKPVRKLIKIIIFDR